MSFLCRYAVLVLLLLSTANVPPTDATILEAVYWEVKPYIFINEKNETDGIIPRIFERAYHLCRDKIYNGTTNHTKDKTLMSFIHKERNRHDFNHLLHVGKYGVGKLENVSLNRAFWVPISSYVDAKHETYISDKKLKSFVLFKSKSVAVIVPRHAISLPNKIIRGIQSCRQIFVIALILAVFFGMLVWFLEHFRNNDYPKTFYKGCFVALWWSMVSMTTVGYGDVVPQSAIGRFVGISWLFVGMMIGCVMTATMTDVVSGVEDLSVYGKTVSVLSDSYEQKIASQDYRANVVPADSYEEVIHLVRRGKAFAAMINADVAAWYQEFINADIDGSPLHIVETLPANININCLAASKPDPIVQEMFKCMYAGRDEIYESSYDYFQRYCHIDKLYIGSMVDILWSSTFIQGLLAVILIMVIVGLLSDLFNYISHKSTEDKEKTLKRTGISGSASMNGIKGVHV